MLLFSSLEMFTRVLSWISVPFALLGILLILIEVLPVQLLESRTYDNIVVIRRLLPVLTLAFSLLAIPVILVIGYNISQDVNGHNIVTNMLRTSINLIIFIEGLSWNLIYGKD